MTLTTEADTIVAMAIRRRMEKRGLSQKALARKAELGDTYVRDILNGRNKNPRSDHLAAIATALNCSVLDPIDPEAAKAPIRDSEVVEKAEERALLAYWRALPRESRELLVLQMFRLRSDTLSSA